MVDRDMNSVNHTEKWYPEYTGKLIGVSLFGRFSYKGSIKSNLIQLQLQLQFNTRGSDYVAAS